MPLTPSQINCISSAASSYAFPPAYFNYSSNAPVTGLTMGQVEARIRHELLGAPADVKNGLSNVLYWGFAQMGGLAAVRVDRFRSSVGQHQLKIASHLFTTRPCPTLVEIGAIKLPQFSGVSFASKVRMFLDPTTSATLDKQIMKIVNHRSSTVLAAVRQSKTSIPISARNSAAYETWCARLADIQRSYLPNLRVVDVERGLFHLIQSGLVPCAADILADA